MSERATPCAVQAGPVSRISLPDTSTEGRQKFGFCFYESVVWFLLGVQPGMRDNTLQESSYVQESAKYAHALFQNTVKLYGSYMRVDYSPQGTPETIGTQPGAPHNNSTAHSMPGSLAAAGGGTIIKRKNRIKDNVMG